MNILDEIKDGLRFGPVRRLFARMRRYPNGRVNDHIAARDWADRILMPNTNTPEWRISHNITTVEEERRAADLRLAPPICASCKRRGWHWEEYEANAGVMRRKATCIGNGEYHDPYRSDLDDWGGVH